jgi:hypothetical protein
VADRRLCTANIYADDAIDGTQIDPIWSTCALP